MGRFGLLQVAAAVGAPHLNRLACFSTGSPIVLQGTAGGVCGTVWCWGTRLNEVRTCFSLFAHEKHRSVRCMRYSNRARRSCLCVVDGTKTTCTDESVGCSCRIACAVIAVAFMPMKIVGSVVISVRGSNGLNLCEQHHVGQVVIVVDDEVQRRAGVSARVGPCVHRTSRIVAHTPVEDIAKVVALLNDVRAVRTTSYRRALQGMNEALGAMVPRTDGHSGQSCAQALRWHGVFLERSHWLTACTAHGMQ